MAVYYSYRLNVDFTLAQQVETANGKVAFVPYVQFYAGGTAFDVTITGPLGSRSAATSVSTTASTEDVARTGIITETAPATDTASSGLNGRLQRIAQRLTSLIALFPSSIGAKTSAGSLSVVMATDAAGATVTDYSIPNMSGASQSVVAAGNGRNLIYMQALSTNVGTIWVNLAGGTAVVGSGVPIAPGGITTIQPGIANAITGIAATANDDLTVYAG